jgi:hypothetical protein
MCSIENSEACLASGVIKIKSAVNEVVVIHLQLRICGFVELIK